MLKKIFRGMRGPLRALREGPWPPWPSFGYVTDCCGVKHLEGFDLRGRRGENLGICSINLKESGLTTLCRMKILVGTAVKIDERNGQNERRDSVISYARTRALTNGSRTLPQNHGMRARSNAPTFPSQFTTWFQSPETRRDKEQP